MPGKIKMPGFLLENVLLGSSVLRILPTVYVSMRVLSTDSYEK